MIGYYRLDESILNKINTPIKNIENNIYDLCCPLVVEDKDSFTGALRYLYDILEIPIISYNDLDEYYSNEDFEFENYIKSFSDFLKMNISIELSEEEQLGHLLRVAKYAYLLANSLGLSKKEIKDIYIAALFHDIGKSKIPMKIVGKKGKLTDDEYKEMKKHSLLAREVVGGFLSEEVIRMIESHHERMDGSGYNKGIMPTLGVQIIGIADSYDAMVSSRVYHKGKSRDEAMNELMLCTISKKDGGKGVLYNKDLVLKFMEIQK